MQGQQPETAAVVASYRKRAESVGAICALPCFLYWYLSFFVGILLFNQNATVLFGLAFFSAFAGFFTVVTVTASDLPLYIIRPLALRAAIRAALITIFLGGGLMTLASTLYMFGFRFLAPIELNPLDVVFLTALAVLPSLFASMLGGMVGSSFRARPQVLDMDPRAAVIPASVHSTSALSKRNLMPAIITLALLGYLSPCTLAFRPDESAPAPVITKAPVAEPEPETEPEVYSKPETTIERFSYEKPEGFDAALASRRHVVATKRLQNVNDHLPAVISPQGRLLAYCSSASGFLQVVVIDLHTLDSVARISVPDEPIHLAWAPDEERLFYTTDGRCGVLTLDTSRNIPLPIPSGRDLPSGTPWWWAENEIYFADQAGQCLDLDSLAVFPATVSPVWQSLSESEREAWSRKEKNAMSSTARIAFSTSMAVAAFRPPSQRSGQSAWKVKAEPQFAVKDQVVAIDHRLPEVPLNSRGRLFSTEDGAVLVSIAADSATLFYLGLEDDTVRRGFVVDMGIEREPDSESSEMKTLMENSALSLFICGPLINPLTGKTIGPNRGLVKGRAQLISWSGREAQIWIVDHYRDVSEGDVVADAHAWMDHQPHSVETPLDDGWFAVLAPIRHTADDFALARKKVGEISVQPESDVAVSPRMQDHQTIVEFVRSHHRKASNRDLNGFVADYAIGGVDFFSHGNVDRDFIRQDQAEYLSTWSRIEETVIGDVKTRRLLRGRYSADYEMRFTQTKADGSWASGISAISLQLELPSSKPQIIRQRAQVRELQKGDTHR